MEEIPNIGSVEDKEGSNKLTEVEIRLQRHFEKDEAGNLSETGIADAIESGEKKLGKQLNKESPEEILIKNYFSLISRAGQSAELEEGGMRSQMVASQNIRIGHSRPKEGLSNALNLKYLNVPQVVDYYTPEVTEFIENFFTHNKEKGTPVGEEELIHELVTTENQKVREYFDFLVSGICYELSHFINVVKRYKKIQNLSEEKKKVNKIFSTMMSHSGFIEPFLISVAGDQIEADPINPNGQDIFEKAGGIIGFGESLGVRLSVDNSGSIKDNSLFIDLDDKTYRIDIDKIYDKAASYLTRKQQIIRELAQSNEDGQNTRD